MRQLNETEVYKLVIKSADLQKFQTAVDQKLNKNIGIITKEHIEPELMQLRVKMRSSYFPMLGEAITLFEENGGQIRLFSIGAGTDGRSAIPIYYPYFPARGKMITRDSGNIPVIFANMSRIGQWAPDEKSYTGASFLDLYTVLESGLIGKKLLIDRMSEKVFDNNEVLDSLTRIYVKLFSEAMRKTMTVYDPGFTTDAVQFLIAKFFQLYVLKKTPGSSIDDLAASIVPSKTSLGALKNYEDIHSISYDSLSGFLYTIGTAVYNEPIILAQFHNSWISMYGDGMTLTIEYVPYLIHFLLAALHNSYIGGASKLQYRVPQFKKELNKLYTSLVSILR